MTKRKSIKRSLSDALIGPLRQAFIDFFDGSGYTAGFGQNRVSGLRLEPVYKKKNNR
jgi:hypothetical protein